MEWIVNPQIWLALVTLTAIEIVLGIDNIIFISIMAGKLPPAQRERARVIGLSLAMIIRILLLLSLVWLMRLTAPLFVLFGMEISGRDLIVIGGGLFLLAKSTMEIHDKLEGAEEASPDRPAVSFRSVIIQILLLDIIFSLDSIITAIGLAQQVIIMVIAVILAVLVMLVSSRAISDFVDRHPTVKMLALSFLLLIGTALIAEGFDLHIPKGYIYFAMAFSVMVEMLNLKIRKTSAAPVALRKPHVPGSVAQLPGPDAG
jgi:predicted tellurium resistance membrane protein TerC